MAIWQFRVILLPEKALPHEQGVLQLSVPMELAETAKWWSSVTQPKEIEKQISKILSPSDAWSDSMRTWGEQDGNDAYICYTDESRNVIEEIAFRFDAREISRQLVHQICVLARSIGCAMMTPEYGILLPDESLVLKAIQTSLAGRYVKDPVSALQGQSDAKVQERINFVKNFSGKPQGKKSERS